MNEVRSHPGTVQVRFDAHGGRLIVGHAAVFNRLSRNLGGFVEQVAPGAFSDSFGRGWPDVVARYEHDSRYLLGTSYSGSDRPLATLRLSIDSAGLHYEVSAPRTRADVVELVERGDVRHSSFAFRTLADDWTLTSEGFPLRTLVSVELVDVAPVVTPAYPDATAGLRSLALRADADYGEVTKLANENRLAVLWGKRDPGPRPVKRGPILGAAARERIIERQSAKGNG